MEIPAEPEPSSPTLHHSPIPKDETPEILRLPTLVLGEEGDADSHGSHDSPVLAEEGTKSSLPAASVGGLESGDATAVAAGDSSESGGVIRFCLMSRLSPMLMRKQWKNPRASQFRSLLWMENSMPWSTRILGHINMLICYLF